ncbi:iron complex outermembrane receptor protein [Stenotrophomonas sp. 2619]|uniref:TonB-dependent receptor plug domain-containing protein n=1 Tax=Stenotrophomonas sp. 2619 TaxID=3156316 RepID=UPI0033937774
MLRFSALTSAIALVFAAPAFADTAPAPDSTTLQTVVVTGSNIKRTDTAGPNPVQVVTREQIEQTGKSTLTDVLRSLSANAGNSYDEQYTGSFAAGSASIGLRGLSPKNTLVLVNGYRVANFGFALNTQDTFVDLNALPISAVERIEVLKDGASAVYGSDAIAGVVNIILRRNFEGVGIGGAFGTATQGGLDEKKANLLAGIGNLERDGWNVLFGLDLLKRDRLDADERAYTRSGDFRDRAGGRLAGWSTAGGNWLANPRQPVPFAPCPTGSELRPYSDFGSTLPGNACAFNAQPFKTLQPGAERLQASLSATKTFGDRLELFADVLYSHNQADQIFSAPLTVGPGLRAYNPATGTLVDIPAVLPVGHPNNSTGAPLPFEYSFFDIGPRLKDNTQVFYRVLAGARGTTERWDWEVAAETSQSEQREYVDNFIDRYAFEQILRDGSYNFLDPASTPGALEALRLQTKRPGWYQLDAASIKASTSFLDLPAGPIGFAWGAEVRRESLDARTSAQVLSGTELRPAINIVDGERRVSAAYAEFSVPLHRTLELQVAGRGDHYDDFGNAFSPKVALRWQPLDALLLRGSFSRGFRAPSLPEIAQGQTISYGSVVDPFDPLAPGGSRGVTNLRTGNPNLEAERSKNYNVGVVWAPDADTSVGVDVYRIEQDNLIKPDNAQFIVNNPDLFPGRVQRDAQGRIQIITNQYANQGELETSGIDLDISRTFRTEGWGTVTLAGSWSHLLTFKQPLVAGQAPVEGAGNNRLGALPRTRGTTSLAWALGDWQSTLSLQYIAGYDQRVATQTSNPGLNDRIKAYHQLDLYVAYTGLPKTTLSLSVQNLTDKDPPFDPAGGSNGFDITQYNLRGTFVSLGAKYRF